MTSLTILKENYESFALANYRSKRVYLSGMSVSLALPKIFKVCYFDIDSQSWMDAPESRVQRKDHSSIGTRSHIFLLGGCALGGSIESLNVEQDHQKWQVILTHKEIVDRTHAALVKLDKDRIMVYGGTSSESGLRMAKNGYIVDTSNNELK